ncbi:S8 family serine peptidase [Chryseobacterium gambrini]|uniref:S8 family serine peptidase n=1 Tax=Chryseobacterium gambrini TaxID=373672 RepID=A0AAJ1R3Q6_9FLAO|nr:MULTISPECIES: S8 family serine peptidase [Chryseobacterium]MDN4011754.1 S8 family serine peptidase [Chryseobacterium gambrini]MDN4029273.1 S8 family serine peptidase [Chryseobacterium gambrini]QWA39061.1 S8 family peptidase [Chryseobacterium sp. ZHDP1]
MRRTSFALGFLFLNILCFSQQSKSLYYIEFKNSSNKPQTVKQNDKSKTLSFNNQNIEVIKYEEAFWNFSSQKLKNTSLIEFRNEKEYNDFAFSNKSDIVKSEKIDTRDEDILLQNVNNNSFLLNNIKPASVPYLFTYTPNDYYLFPQDIAHTHLDLINAREAWDYSKGDGVTVGISDTSFRLTHAEFENKISTLPGQTVSSTDLHGNVVAGLAGSKTDNNFGSSSIGFNNKLLVTDHYSWGSWGYLKQMSDNGARIINMSWLSTCSFTQTEQDAVNEIYNNGTVLVAAAGNSSCGNTYAQVFPASYQNVIAVSGVGHYNDIGASVTTNVKDVHYSNYPILENKLQNNEDVDIVAPAYDIEGLPYSGCDTCLGRVWIGTSLASPIISGTLSLLFSSNNCLSPIEAETILKLTAANIDQIPQNQIFTGLLGAGRVDAGKANKMAWQMNSSNGGEVLIENKKFNRWNFELTNSPESIRIQNESFTQNANVKFKAKKSIILDTNTVLEPGNGKSHYFYIENQNTCFNFNPNQNKSLDTGKIAKNSSSKIVEIKNEDITLYPIPAIDNLFIKTTKELKNSTIKIFDVSNRLVLENKISIINTASVDISNLLKGTYFIEITNENSKLKYFKKFVKE